MELVAINDDIFSPKEAKISVFDRGFIYGDAVYEVTRSYGSVLFALEMHVERLFKSAEMIDLDLQKTPAQIMDYIYGIYKKSALEDVYMRIQVTRGEGVIGLDPKNAFYPNYVVWIKKLDPSVPHHYTDGVSVITTSRIRNTKKALDPNIKSGNFLNNILAYGEALKHQAYDAVFLNAQGQITEGTTSNIFLVKNNVIKTPPKDFDLLQGITRRIVFDICKNNNSAIQETALLPEDLESADEVFLTSSIREVMPITKVNHKIIANGKPGVVTKKLHDLYQKYVQDYCKRK